MNAENPVQIDLFGVSATRTKDTRLTKHSGGTVRITFCWPVTFCVGSASSGTQSLPLCGQRGLGGI